MCKAPRASPCAAASNTASDSTAAAAPALLGAPMLPGRANGGPPIWDAIWMCALWLCLIDYARVATGVETARGSGAIGRSGGSSVLGRRRAPAWRVAASAAACEAPELVWCSCLTQLARAPTGHSAAASTAAPAAMLARNLKPGLGRAATAAAAALQQRGFMGQAPSCKVRPQRPACRRRLQSRRAAAARPRCLPVSEAWEGPTFGPTLPAPPVPCRTCRGRWAPRQTWPQTPCTRQRRRCAARCTRPKRC